MTMDEHDDTIAMLRGAAGSGREATGADVTTAMRAGKKIRRRRRSLQAVGSGFVLSAGLGVMVMAGGVNGQSTEIVPASPAAPPAVDAGPTSGTGDAKPTAGPSVATPPPGPAGSKPTLTPEDKARMATAADMRHANNRLLLDVLGKDWAATDDADPFGAELIRGTASDRGMPDEFAVNAGIEVLGDGGHNITIAEQCAPMVEKGLHTSACTPVDTGNGTVYLQHWTSTPGEWKPTGGRADITYGAGTTVYLERVDHSLVRVQMLARGAQSATASGQKTATAWLSKYDQALEKVAADPRVQPHAEPANATSVAVSDHQRDQLILQQALGGGWTVGGGGPVGLEPGSQKASELPSDYYGANAELSKISSAAFHAACDAKTGLAACETKTLDDGTVIHYRSWADRDAADSEMRGESAVYLVRKDGSVLLANIEVTGTQVTAAQADEHAKVVRQWMDSLQDALIKAVTDPNVVGTPSTN
jgi:hypothetical protein